MPELLPQPCGFDGFRMSQKVADANDLPSSKVKDFPDFLAELDARRPGDQVDVTEGEDRLAEVAELLGPIGEAFPRLAAVLPPNLPRAVMTPVGGCLSLKPRLDRRVPLDVGIELGQEGVQVIAIPRLDGTLDSLHVLLRHRPPSIPQAYRPSRRAQRSARRAQAFRREILHAMSEQNVETVRRVYEGVNARLEAPRELFDPEYEFDNTELWPDVVEVLGFEAAQAAMREYWETFEAYHVEIDEVIYADEGRVVDVVRDGGRMRGTDAEVWNRFFHVWTLRDGRIVRLSIHTDRDGALKAAGLSE